MKNKQEPVADEPSGLLVNVDAIKQEFTAAASDEATLRFPLGTDLSALIKVEDMVEESVSLTVMDGVPPTLGFGEEDQYVKVSSVYMMTFKNF